MRISTALAAAAASTALVLGAVATPAQAAALGNSCGPGYNPAGAQNTYVVAYEDGVGDDPSAEIQLKAGELNGRKIVWAKVIQASVGDGVSLRWSDNRGTDYWRCGRPADSGYARIASGNDQYTLAVPVTSSSRAFKVCGHDSSSGKYDCAPTHWVTFG